MSNVLTVRPGGGKELTGYDLVQESKTKTLFCLNDHVVAVIVEEWVHDFKTYRVRSLDPYFHRLQYVSVSAAADDLWRSCSGQSLTWSRVVDANRK